MKDEKLLKLLRTDPGAGMEKLVRLYSGLVYEVVSARLSNLCDSSEIEDCVTDVFLDFYRKIDTFEPVASVKNYLAVLARNKACGCARRKQITEIPPEDGLLLEFPDESDVAEATAEKLLLESVLDEIKRMGHPDSAILIRKYYLGQSSKDIAAALGMTVSNVDTRAHRAIEKLRQKFGGKL